MATPEKTILKLQKKRLQMKALAEEIAQLEKQLETLQLQEVLNVTKQYDITLSDLINMAKQSGQARPASTTNLSEVSQQGKDVSI